MHLCSVKGQRNIISILLILLVLTSNMVLSIDAVFCHCFKTTTFHVSGLEKECCDDHLKDSCTKSECCQKAIEKPACKSTTKILVSNSEDLFKDQSGKISKSHQEEYSASCSYCNLIYSDSSVDRISFTSQVYYPSFKHSRPFLQTFRC